MLAIVCFEIASSFDQHVDSVLHDFLMEDIRDVPEAPNFAGTSLRHVVTPVTRLANAVPSLSIRAIALLWPQEINFDGYLKGEKYSTDVYRIISGISVPCRDKGDSKLLVASINRESYQSFRTNRMCDKFSRHLAIFNPYFAY